MGCLIRVVNLNFNAMKLSASLLQAITLGVSIAAVTAGTTSCEKEKITKRDTTENGRTDDNSTPGTCPACGMG